MAEYNEDTFSFETLRNNVSNFCLFFNKYTQDQRQKLLDDKNEHLKQCSELWEKQKKTEKELERAQLREKEVMDNIEKEKLEQLTITQEIQRYTEILEDMNRRKALLAEEIERQQSVLTAKRELKAKEEHHFMKQKSLDNPELQFWEKYLGMRIEGVREDELRIVFVNIDDKNWKKRFSFHINFMEKLYEVTKCNPPLSNLEELVERLNKTRNFFRFLKEIRMSFYIYAHSNS
ncbi:kinetochore protein Spc25 [Schizosaccharomyces japonicus yFS275]|uniref:Kinetochore protein SPC25 n=1 Tax=Schizosaccharomyces japonicus (strain yFS275 / FY16936) TaxID=402676 RepID=B6K4W9_SCHJY|nr:kinetochore protein Spc25 [Schizosaccharomyces japonicus yFS275]EEB08526.2 kinetochore protein Spc25 [Schizosaccharomyces japonicus yFS275]